jgi:hypothetical protein
MIDREMVDRLATAGNGGSSFPNKYAKQYATDFVVTVLFALTKEDIAKISYELSK